MNQGGIPQQQAVGGMDYNNFSNMNRSTLNQLHTNLAMLLGKGLMVFSIC